MLVSVIVPVYNSEKYIAEALDSILASDYADIEVVCVDDGSTDNSLQILQKYAIVDGRGFILNKIQELVLLVIMPFLWLKGN